jgi:hypothetical protein
VISEKPHEYIAYHSLEGAVLISVGGKIIYASDFESPKSKPKENALTKGLESVVSELEKIRSE